MSDEAARLRAFDIAEKLALPVRARSWTARELRRNELRLFWLATGFFALICGGMVLGAATDGGRESRMMLPWLIGTSLLLMPAIGWGAWRRLKKHAGYRDPMIVLEVHQGGIAIDWGEQHIDLGWAEVDYAPYWQAVRSGTTFLGIRLNMPAGPFYIIDQWFSGGCKAAAAIVAEHDKWRVLRRTG